MSENIILKFKDLGDYFFKIYGLSDSENKDIEGFYDNSRAAMQAFLAQKDLASVKQIVDINNEISSYCGLPLFEIFAQNDEELLLHVLTSMIDLYLKEKNNTKKDNAAIKDVGETVSNILFLCPDRVLRKFLLQIEPTQFDYIKSLSSRPMIFSVIIARLAEIYTSSANEDCVIQIVEIIKILINRIEEGDNVISDYPHAVSISLKDSKRIVSDLISRGNKKATLDQFKVILTRKFELGQVFHAFIMLTSCSADIVNSDLFTAEMFQQCLRQMKLYQILEIAIHIEKNLKPEKIKVLQEAISGDGKSFVSFNYEDKIKSFLDKYKSAKYGILIRQVNFLPTHNGNIQSGLDFIFDKLNTVSNNLTAIIADKSLSITICLMSKNSLFADFSEESESKDQKVGSNVAKMKDKDIMKKIKESDIAYLTIDQMIARNIISILLSFIDEYKINQDVDINEIKTLGFKNYIKKYKILTSFEVYSSIIDTFLSKITPS